MKKSKKVAVAKKPRKVKEKKVKVADSDFKVSVIGSDETFESSGPSIIEAFQALPQRPHITFKGMLRIERKGQVVEKFLYPSQIRKLMGYKIQRAFFAKRFAPCFRDPVLAQ